MTKKISSLCSSAILALVVGLVLLGTPLNAQQSAPDGGAARRGQTQQPPTQSPDQANQPAPDPQAQSGQAPSEPSDTQTFSGTIVKADNKYVLQDSASGNTYDIDRQDLAKEHEGQKVRIAGTLDPNGKLIHVK